MTSAPPSRSRVLLREEVCFVIYLALAALGFVVALLVDLALKLVLPSEEKT